MDENHQHRHRLAMLGLVRTYGLIAKVMAMLPLPIALPPLAGSIYADEVNTGLIRAWEALQDLPMDDEIREWAGLLILDWITACAVLFDDEQDEQDWQLHLVGVQIARMLAGADLVMEQLTQDE